MTTEKNLAAAFRNLRRLGYVAIEGGTYEDVVTERRRIGHQQRKAVWYRPLGTIDTQIHIDMDGRNEAVLNAEIRNVLSACSVEFTEETASIGPCTWHVTVR